MKYKTLFRILLKVIGVYCFVQGVGDLVTRITFDIKNLVQFAGGSSTYPWTNLLYALSAIVRIAAGLYLFFGGEWIVNRAIPSNRPYCHECGYDLTAAPQNRCPECGTPFKSEDVQPPTGIEIKE